METWKEFFQILVTDLKFYVQVSLWTYAAAAIPSQILHFLGYGNLTGGYIILVNLLAVAFVLSEGGSDKWKLRVWAHLLILWACYVTFLVLFDLFFVSERTTTWHTVFPTRTSIVRIRHLDSYLMAVVFVLFEIFIIFYIIFAYVSLIRFAVAGFKWASRGSRYCC